MIALAPDAAGLAWWLAGRTVRPIERIRSVAEHIEAHDLGERIGLSSGPTEIVALAASFDAMLERLHRAAGSQLEVIDDISHELRTPIAVLIANADVALARPSPTTTSYRADLERSRRAAERLQSTVERLLRDARDHARTLDRHPADLMETVRTVTGDMRAVAEPAAVTIDLSGPDQLLGTWDTSTLARAITNVLDNAIRHSPAGTTVLVRVADSGGRIDIAVSDHGPGIEPRQLDQVFERSWRADSSGGGAGLGLHIARQIARAHGGDVTVRSPDSAGYSTTFVFSIAR
ncbi:MAG: HAMP domain-containing protein [Actinobacteria bacterium]|nr:HAMP domain-containing protein [Actinomycetota bacterium]